jgi:hypothetical protein
VIRLCLAGHGDLADRPGRSSLLLRVFQVRLGPLGLRVRSDLVCLRVRLGLPGLERLGSSSGVALRSSCSRRDGRRFAPIRPDSHRHGSCCRYLPKQNDAPKTNAAMRAADRLVRPLDCGRPPCAVADMTISIPLCGARAPRFPLWTYRQLRVDFWTPAWGISRQISFE